MTIRELILLLEKYDPETDIDAVLSNFFVLPETIKTAILRNILKAASSDWPGTAKSETWRDRTPLI